MATTSGQGFRVVRRWVSTAEYERHRPQVIGGDRYDPVTALLSLLGAVVVAVGVTLLLPAWVEFFGAAGRWTLLVLALPASVGARQLGRRPWMLEVRDPQGATVAVEWVAGWSAAGSRAGRLLTEWDASTSRSPQSPDPRVNWLGGVLEGR
jgi:hypothetical protein